MPQKPKQLNWAVIKKRYFEWEDPSSIAKSYGVPPKTISNKAYEEGWTSQRKEISENVSKAVESEILSFESQRQALRDEALEIFSHMFRTLKQTAENNDNPYLFDGEGRMNPLYQEALKVAGKLVVSDQLSVETNDSAGFVEATPVDGYESEKI